MSGGIFEHVACKYLYLSEKRCIFFPYHKLNVFSAVIEAEGFSCFVALTGLLGEEKLHLMFQVDVQEKSKESNKWKLKQLSLPLSAVKQSGSAKVKQLILFLCLKTAVSIQAKQPQESLIVCAVGSEPSLVAWVIACGDTTNIWGELAPCPPFWSNSARFGSFLGAIGSPRAADDPVLALQSLSVSAPGLLRGWTSCCQPKIGMQVGN